MAAGDVGGVVHAAVVVVPAFCIAGEGPGLALPDEVLNAESLGVVFEPVRRCPPGFELLRYEAGVNGVAKGDVAGPFEGVFDDDQPAVPAGHRGVRDDAVGDGLVVRYRSG